MQTPPRYPYEPIVMYNPFPVLSGRRTLRAQAFISLKLMRQARRER